MDAELRHLEEFDNELSSEGLKIMGGILCGAHYLESNLQDANSPLIVFDGSKSYFPDLFHSCKFMQYLPM